MHTIVLGGTTLTQCVWNTQLTSVHIRVMTHVKLRPLQIGEHNVVHVSVQVPPLLRGQQVVQRHKDLRPMTHVVWKGWVRLIDQDGGAAEPLHLCAGKPRDISRNVFLCLFMYSCAAAKAQAGLL